MSGIRLTEVDDATIDTPPAGHVTIFADDVLGPAYKDDAGAVIALEGASGTPGADGADGADAPPMTYFDHGSTGSTEPVDVSVADVQRLVANAATVTLTLTGWPAAGTPGLVQLWLEQDVTGHRLWAFPAAVTWGDAGAPDWSTRSGLSVDLVSLESVDGGVTVVATLAGRAGATGAAGTNGTNGTAGGAIAIPYTFSTTTTDSDPGSGNLRLSNATQASAVTIRADLLDALGTDWTAVLDTLADASNTVKGHIRLYKTADPTKWLVYTVSAVATPSGYRNITVANVASSGVNPLTNGDAITLAFSRSGDQGSTVGSGTLTTIEEVDGSPTDSAVTKLVVPNGTLAIVGHVATYTLAAPTAPGDQQASRVTRTAGDVSTTSLTFVDLTGASITLTTGAHRCKVEFTASVFVSGSVNIYLDLEIDGSRIGGDQGVISLHPGALLEGNGSFTYLTDVLSAGSHTFKIKVRVNAGTGTVQAHTTTTPYFFTVIETGLST